MYRKLIAAKKDQEGDDRTCWNGLDISYRYSLLYGGLRSYCMLLCDIPNLSYEI